MPPEPITPKLVSMPCSYVKEEERMTYGGLIKSKLDSTRSGHMCLNYTIHSHCDLSIHDSLFAQKLGW